MLLSFYLSLLEISINTYCLRGRLVVSNPPKLSHKENTLLRDVVVHVCEIFAECWLDARYLARQN